MTCCQLALAVGLSVGLPACVTVYHPISGLHRPIALDMSYANFENLTIALQCQPGEVVNQNQARALCRKLKSLFENQGAQVKLKGAKGSAAPATDSNDSSEGNDAGKLSAPPGTALTIRLSSRLLHEDTTSYLFFDVTTGYTFAQDVTITDESGFLLIREHLTGRLIQRMGLSFSSGQEDFSKDFYGQVSQLTLNAQMRRQVLLESVQQQVGTN